MEIRSEKSTTPGPTGKITISHFRRMGSAWHTRNTPMGYSKAGTCRAAFRSRCFLELEIACANMYGCQMGEWFTHWRSRIQTSRLVTCGNSELIRIPASLAAHRKDLRTGQDFVSTI